MSDRRLPRKILIALVAGVLVALAPAILAEETKKAEKDDETKKPAAKSSATVRPAPASPSGNPAAKADPRCEETRRSRLDFSTLEDFFGDTGGRFSTEAGAAIVPTAASKDPAVQWKLVPAPKPAAKDEKAPRDSAKGKD